MDLLKETFVWRRVDETLAIRYACLENLSTGQYRVQAMDFFRPYADEKLPQFFQKQFVETLTSQSPSDWDDWQDHLIEAIERMEASFSDFFTEDMPDSS